MSKRVLTSIVLDLFESSDSDDVYPSNTATTNKVIIFEKLKSQRRVEFEGHFQLIYHPSSMVSAAFSINKSTNLIFSPKKHIHSHCK